jgi:DNA-binding MarR family transcriptional regulator
VVTLTDAGRKLMDDLFPKFNKQEQKIAGAIPNADQGTVAEALRLVTKRAESPS